MIDNETTVRIEDRQRIVRILQRLSRGALPLFVRQQPSSSTAVKAKSGHLERQDDKIVGFHLHGVSPKGIQHILACRRVHVEFMMLSTKIITSVPILKASETEGRVVVGVPEVLISVQRRENERFKTLGSLQPYLKLSENRSSFKVSPQNYDLELATTPVWPPYQDFKDCFMVKDVSLGGFSVQTVFPGQTYGVETGMVDYEAELSLATLGKVQVGIELRWMKRLRQTEKFRDRESSYFTHQLGFLFLKDQSQPGFQDVLNQYIGQLSRLEGI